MLTLFIIVIIALAFESAHAICEATNFSTCALPASQYYALKTFYESTNGKNWNWPSTSNTMWQFEENTSFSAPCESNWQGLTCACCNNQFNIISIELHDFGLYGTLPGAAIANLTSLATLSLENSKATGPVNNKIIGQIPFEIGYVTSLTDVSLNNNLLTGTLPSSIGFLQNAIVFSVFQNSIGGTIPTSLGLMTSLEVIHLFSNYFTGTIPSTIGNLTSLTQLWFHENRLTGTLPPSLGNLTNLVNIYLNHNSLSGSIPNEYSKWAKLENLQFAVNRLSGTVPSFLFSYSNLVTIALTNNCFRGSLPEDICEYGMTRLQTIYLNGMSSNSICPGNIKVNKARPKYVKGVFQAQIMSGTIPSCLWALLSLTTLRLSGNGLVGSIQNIPADSALSWLDLSNNKITGSIPLSVQMHDFSQTLDLASNMISGTLIANFPLSMSMTQLQVSVNRLSGNLPASFFGQMGPNMTTFNVLAGNLFGCIDGNLPKADPNHDTYSCGSSDLNSAVFTWVGLVSSVSIILLAIVFLANTLKISPNFFTIWCEQAFVRFKFWWKCITSLTVAQTRYDIPQTVLFLECLRSCGAMATVIFAAMICICLPFYLGFSFGHEFTAKYSTVSYMYTWAVSCAYLRGIPTVIVISFVVLAMLLSIQNIWLTQRSRSMGYLTKNSLKREANSVRLSFIITPNYLFANRRRIWTKFIFPLTLQAINLGMTLLVNVSYVTVISSNSTLSPMLFLLLQCAVGCFKFVWGLTFIQWASNQLRLSSVNGMRHRFMMLLCNYIIAPCIACLVSQDECFHYVFVAYPSNSHEFTVNMCSQYNVISPFNLPCGSYTEIQFSTTYTPPFLYSFHCAASLFDAYIPVLLYSYTISGLLVPIMRVLFLYRPVLRYWLTPFSFMQDKYNAKLMKANDSRIVVDGKACLVQMTVHLTVMLTFGLACPLLGLAVTFTLVGEVLVRSLTIGTFLHITGEMSMDEIANGSSTINPVQALTLSLHRLSRKFSSAEPPSLSTIEESRSTASEISSEDNKSEDKTVDNSMRKTESYDADTVTERITQTFSKVQETVKIMEDSNRDAWSASTACISFVTMTVSCFWGLIFFDMIGDQNGISAGMGMALGFAVGIPIIVVLVGITRKKVKSKLIRHLSEMSLSPMMPFNKSVISGDMLNAGNRASEMSAQNMSITMREQDCMDDDN